MKKIRLLIICFAAAGLLITSCNPDSLTNLNRNPDEIAELVPEYAFTAVVLESYPSQHNGLAQGMQYYATYKEIPAVGDKFYNFNNMIWDFNNTADGQNDGVGHTNVNNVYRLQMQRLKQITDKIGNGPENVNKLAACTILKVLVFHRMTDALGDLPYSEAMKGDANRTPKYDTQESIYRQMLSELDAALTSMDKGQPDVFGKADPFYAGNIDKWKKLGYTLMMRLGMRMSEVEPALAQEWVEKAATGGVMTENGDIAYLRYADITDQNNPRVNSMISGNFAAPGGDNVEGGKWAATFINHLKSTGDPRLYVLSVVWQPVGDPKTATEYTPDTVAANQRGMVNGSINSIPADFHTYSEPSLLYLNRAAPYIVLSPAEAYLLRAEAAVRGWSVNITAEEAYEKAVRAAMARWSLWPAVSPHSGDIRTSDVDAYLAKNPFTGTDEEKLQQIATQKWVSLFDDEREVWSNWRRVKWPVFNYANWDTDKEDPDNALVSYPANVTKGRMFRRFEFPLTEETLNGANLKEALDRQGFTREHVDQLQGRVWWDVDNGTGQSNLE
jgi:hypothetical protein